MNTSARLRTILVPYLLLLSFMLAAEGATILYPGLTIQDEGIETIIATLEENYVTDSDIGDVTDLPESYTTEILPEISTEAVPVPENDDTTESEVNTQTEAATTIPDIENGDTILEKGDDGTTEAKPIEAVSTEPAITEPAITEPARTEPSSTEPASTLIPSTISSLENSTEGLNFVCEKAGSVPSPTDCNMYYTCQPIVGSGEPMQFQSTEMHCPSNMAYSEAFSRCSRDISTCSDDTFECLTEGAFADPQTNRSYYRCMAGLNGFHKFHVECPILKTFLPVLGKCFIDFNKLDSLTQLVESGIDDEMAVNAEIKQIKKADKIRAKNEKLKEKMAKKLQKELDKKAAKEARKQMKLALKNESNVSGESDMSVSA